MMILLKNMALNNLKDNILAKANNEIEFYYPPAKAGGNSKAGVNSMIRNAALAHSKNELQTSLGLSHSKSRRIFNE